MTAREHRQNAVLYSGRQRVGPFVYSLVGDPDRRRRRGDSPAEQLDCFGLDHAVLNHSSALIATMVPDECAAFALGAAVRMSYRLNQHATEAERREPPPHSAHGLLDETPRRR